MPSAPSALLELQSSSFKSLCKARVDPPQSSCSPNHLSPYSRIKLNADRTARSAKLAEVFHNLRGELASHSTGALKINRVAFSPDPTLTKHLAVASGGVAAASSGHLPIEKTPKRERNETCG